MKYIKNPDSTYPSAVSWIKAFPKKFFLEPKQRQLIRMMVIPNEDLSPGTYWARIVTSASPTSTTTDTLKQGISAKIKFVLNQITTLLYRVGENESKAELTNSFVKEDSSGVSVFAGIKREGNSPFLGDVIVSVLNDSEKVITDKTEKVSIYYNLTKRFNFKDLKPGSYTAEIKVIHNEKEDIPQSNIKLAEPIIRRLPFKVN